MARQRTMHFARLLRQLRIDAGLTQEELAEAAGISQRAISDLERGINLTARKETARLLANALGLRGTVRTQFEAAARGHGGGPGAVRSYPAATPGSAGRAAARTLPRDIASFTGREPELVRLTDALEAEAADGGVVGIHAIGGMAGIGKTTFAVHAAHRLASRFPDGQIFLRLHGHTPGQPPLAPADALTSLLLMVGITAQRIPADLEARAGLWRDQMSGKRVLLVLDDATSSEHVRPLLPGSAGTLVLITSRRRLTALPEAVPISLDIMDPDTAAELFVRLAAQPGVRPSDSGVAKVVRSCGYLPLAISLMAAQLKHHGTWTAEGLAADLAMSQNRLMAIQAEDNSVAAALDMSYRELTPGQQRFFCRLGLQPGADVDAYAAAALANTDLATARRLLDNLYAHHLIDEPTRGRYRFHDLIREHARALAAIEDRADRDMAIDRLLNYYLHSAHAADCHLARRTSAGLPAAADCQPSPMPQLSDRRQAADWMDAERLNLQAAVDYAALHHFRAYAITIPIVMHGYLRTHGHWAQAFGLHQTALAAARRADDKLGEAIALNNLGDLQHLAGAYPAAVASLTRALELYRQLGNRLGEANAISYLGLIQRLTGDHTAATRNLTRALELYRDVDDRLGEAIALNDLGLVQYLTGDYTAATASQQRALKLYRALGDRAGEASALTYLGAIQLATGTYGAATASQDQALQLYLDLRHPWGQANALNALGDLKRLARDYPAAAASLDQALQLYRDLGYRNGEAQTLNSMGELSLESALSAEARGRFSEALSIACEITAPLEEARALEGIGKSHLLGGQIDEGTAALREALAIYRRINSSRARLAEQALRDVGGNHPCGESPGS